MGLPRAELSLLLTDDSEIQELNRQYREKNSPTDVLSFSLQEGEGGELAGEALGDIVISVETAKRQALELGHSLTEELLRLLVHGVLHLVGYEHENVTEQEARAMSEKEEELGTKIAAEI